MIVFRAVVAGAGGAEFGSALPSNRAICAWMRATSYRSASSSFAFKSTAIVFDFDPPMISLRGDVVVGTDGETTSVGVAGTLGQARARSMDFAMASPSLELKPGARTLELDMTALGPVAGGSIRKT